MSIPIWPHISIGFAGGDVNLYNYVGGNPVNFYDPWGLASLYSRPLGDSTTQKRNALRAKYNVEDLHTQIFFNKSVTIHGNDYTDIGFFGEGFLGAGGLGEVRADETINLLRYVKYDNRDYDDATIARIVEMNTQLVDGKLLPRGKHYRLLKDNCQDFAKDVFSNYEKLLNSTQSPWTGN